MAHEDEEIICPNCGYHATKNYCAQCGQPTHLHHDTFFSLITHFTGHYFHYDSKLWQTLKTLWFKPGELTKAYWKKQRMRYIEPMSLYIFISVAFFLVSAIVPDKYIEVYESPKEDTLIVQGKAANEQVSHLPRIHKDTITNTYGTPQQAKEQKEKKEQIMHNIPKVFFFMIPLMGLVLYLLFIKRKDLFYADHIIYALHFHSFWFSIMFLTDLYLFKAGSKIISAIALMAAAVYFITALRNVYNISWGKAILFSCITAIVYLICIIAILAGLLAIVLR